MVYRTMHCMHSLALLIVVVLIFLRWFAHKKCAFPLWLTLSAFVRNICMLCNVHTRTLLLNTLGYINTFFSLKWWRFLWQKGVFIPQILQNCIRSLKKIFCSIKCIIKTVNISNQKIYFFIDNTPLYIKMMVYFMYCDSDWSYLWQIHFSINLIVYFFCSSVFILCYVCYVCVAYIISFSFSALSFFHFLLLHSSTVRTTHSIYYVLCMDTFISLFIKSFFLIQPSIQQTLRVILWSKKCEKKSVQIKQKWKGNNTIIIYGKVTTLERKSIFVSHLFYNCRRCILFVQSITIERISCLPICMQHAWWMQLHANFSNF